MLWRGVSPKLFLRDHVQYQETPPMSDYRLIALVAVMVLAQGAPALAEQPSMTARTLIDRAQIARRLRTCSSTITASSEPDVAISEPSMLQMVFWT
jgi:hypothetical protein